MSATTMTREEWTRRYANRMKEIAGMSEEDAMECANNAAEENLQQNGDEWLDPEDDADCEMSYWTDDEGGA